MRWAWSQLVCVLAASAIAWGQAKVAGGAVSAGAGSTSTYDQSAGARSGGTRVASAADTSDVLPDAPGEEDPRRDNKLSRLPYELLKDQLGMWTSPGRARLSDATWLVPLGGFAAALFATDSDISRHLSNSPNTLLQYKHISDYGTYSMAGGAAGLYLLGIATNNEHRRESGLLSEEAAIDAVAVVEAMKYASGRERPFVDNANGHFFKGGTSFPSEHSAAAWAIAGIIAHEYPSPFMKFFAYGLAGVVSATRVNAKQHFPSDVLVGSAIGYLASAYVYHMHHNSDLQGSSWELPAVRPDRPNHWQAKDVGSPYVPLDSWIYPALERLAALGYIDSAIMGMRPWTRMECARQVSEAQDRIVEDEPSQNEAAALYHGLTQEFVREIELLSGGDNEELRLESSYTRATEIVGKPLTDGYHFAQTIYDDFGRPEEQGFNNVSGLSGWAEDGPFVAYVRSEYQHSPSAPPLPYAARQAESTDDFAHSIIPPPYPIPPDTVTPEISRARLLDSYVAMNVSDWQFSYGKQSLWWGPSEGGGMMMSDNADPLTMFRIDRVTPFKLPGIFGLLGPMKVEFFLGQYSGYEFMFTPSGLVGQYGQSLRPQPIIHGERFSFKPTTNFEFGMSRTTDYGGPGYPLTMRTFLRSVFSTTLTNPGAPNKPGSRRSGLDFSYRIPRWGGLTFYADGFTEHDTFSPIVGPDVAAWLGGIYLPRLPKIPKMDLRVEGVQTDPPIGGNVGYGFFYYDPTWITGFQNSGHLMGNWVGRQGVGVQAWTTYWFTPRNKLQFGFRHQKVDNQFLPNGGTLADASVRGELWEKTSFNVSALVQYEKWDFPVISSTRQSNVATSLQFTFWPKGLRRTSTNQ
jgi:membrane-associated phospholipid phosphatase